MSFIEYITRVSPPWFQNRWMASLLESGGALFDSMADRTIEGRMAAIPYSGGAKLADGRLIQCEEDVLKYHARDRGIFLPKTAPVISNRYRLSRWRQLHQRRATHRGELENAQAYFLGLATTLPPIDIVFQTGDGLRAQWHSISAKDATWAIDPLALGFDPDPLGTYSISVQNPSNFNYDDRPNLRTRWWAFLRMYGTGITPPNTYDDGHTYDDGARYDEGTLTAQHLLDIVSMFSTWKAAHSWLAGVALVWDDTSVPIDGTPTQDPDGWWSLPNGAGTWRSPVDPMTGFNTRPPTVQWIYDNDV